jgi:AhpC/TSA family
MAKAVTQKTRWVLLSLLLVGAAAGGARAIEVGEKAPDFKLPSTTGLDIALGDFKGKKFVFLEFYSLDFVPA